MLHRREFAIAGLSAAALAAVRRSGFGDETSKPTGGDAHGAHYDKCAQVCSDCQRACSACENYCVELVAGGARHHLTTLRSCGDCADFCATAAQIVARRGVMAELVCQGCAEACARCAKECEQNGQNDKVMTHCAEECRRCEAACREMISSKK